MDAEEEAYFFRLSKYADQVRHLLEDTDFLQPRSRVNEMVNNLDVYKRQAQGILTVRGGMTSHAAVVARGMGKCCVSGCGAINMDAVSYTHLRGRALRARAGAMPRARGRLRL